MTFDPNVLKQILSASTRAERHIQSIMNALPRMTLTGLLLEILLGFWELLRDLIYPPSLKSLRGETAVITGGANGIGREFALQLSRLGVRLVLWDVDAVGLAKTVDDVERRGGKAWGVKCDVADREDVRRAAEETRSKVGEVTMLFNNAGIMPARPFLKFKPEEVEKIFNVNVFSQYWMLQEFLPDFLAADYGHIVSMSSMAGVTGTPYLVPYCSSKFAVKGLMDALFMELRQDHPNSRVQMTTVHPFTVNTTLPVDPTTRFPGLVPITEPDVCAQIAIEAVRRNDEEVFVPTRLLGLTRFGKALPRRVQLAISDYLECGVGYNK